MSKFVKGTAILGVMAISIGIWQLTELEEKENVEVKAKATQSIDDHERTYEMVTIEKEETSEKKNIKEEPVDSHTVSTLKKIIGENGQIKQVISGLGEGITEDLHTLKVKKDARWKEIEKDSKEKQKLLQKLQELTNSSEVQKLALAASENLKQTIEKKSIDFYIETVELFKYLSEQL